jgi:4-amino-4-deoxy-L-arabinose transferase-like glycosyltransferase
MNFENKKRLIVFIVLSFFVFLGGYLRLYRHDDLLHFELDQSRDAIVISEAIEKGPDELPLLGSRAAGTKLRLGPIFYYCEYLSAKLFGNSPAGMNGISVLLSILSIPLIYFLSRRYFSYLISFSITALYSTSLFTVFYSRFAWNPNMLLFFIPAFLFSLLLLVDKRKEKIKPVFIYLAALFLGVITQLHFLAFITFPILLISFFIYRKLLQKFFPTICEKVGSSKKTFKKVLPHYFLAGLLFLSLNVPIFINEYLTGGENAQEFFKAFENRDERGKKKHNSLDKLVRNSLEYSRGYLLLISGSEEAEVPKINFFGKKGAFDTACDRYCRERLPYTAIGVIFFSGGVFFLINNVIKLLKIKKKRRSVLKKIDFLAVHFLLLGITFFAFLSSAYKFPPRFLLITYPVAFVLLGLWLKEISNLIGKTAKGMKMNFVNKRKDFFKISSIISIILILISLNLFFVIKRLTSQIAAHTENPIYFKKDRVLKEDIRFTLIQQNLIVDWILANSDTDPIFVWASPKYYRPFIYHLRYQRDKKESRIFLGYSASCKQADYFAVIQATSPNIFFENGGEKAFISEKSQKFGTFTVHKLAIKDPSLIDEEFCDPLEEGPPDVYARRYTWGEFFDPSSR